MTTETYQPKRLPLVLFPDSKLYEVSRPLSMKPGGGGYWMDKPDEFIADLIETMKASEGVGLSAIQVGVPVRVFVMKAGIEDPIALINPVWYVGAGVKKVKLSEGCLSFPGVFEEVERYDEVMVAYETLDEVGADVKMTGLAAHIVQHEVEHLDGQLFIQHLPIHVRDTIRNKMKKRKRLSNRIEQLMSQKNQTMDSLVRAGLIKTQARPGFRK